MQTSQKANEDSHRGKRQRLKSQDTPVAETTKITDLNDDCLVKIFGYLYYNDLFSVAIANKFVRPAAVQVYKRKYGSKPVKFDGFDHLRPNTLAVVDNGQIIDHSAILEVFSRNTIEIHGLKACLQYLRCFGPVIKDLSIINDNSSPSKRYGYVLMHISKYCANNLVRLSFYGYFDIERFQNIRIQVQTVKVSNSNLNDQLELVYKFFPNLRRLELVGGRMVKVPNQTLFQHLKKLGIWFSTVMESRALLNMCPRLKSLNIFSIYPISIGKLLDAIDGNPLLTHLGVNAVHYELLVNLAELHRLAIEHPVLVEFDFMYLFTADIVMKMLGQLNSLNKFRIKMRPSEFSQLESQLKNSCWLAIARHQFIELQRRP